MKKIIAVPLGDPSMNQYEDISELHILTEMGHFFEIYKLEGKKTYILDIEGRDSARKIINQCIKNYDQKFGK